MRKLAFNPDKEPFYGRVKIDQNELRNARRIHDDYFKQVIGIREISYFATRGHNGKPYFLLGVIPGTDNPERLLPGALEGIPLYYHFRKPMGPVRLGPRIK